ncbi:proline-, glutamic acid- and leucine-rich protein 1 isoform X2 [Cephus cinctus]|uniref:Proline-, glutamic acid- and leucine-rich protein 1 isoform X2 n=1 Tax=Cephus cinctus TaxID=211228 RepID=A0AAJ7FJR0_CEPCN|nr:proline-, glutamic acid- and leucine-rich protein 1 isoform X2 [Cephus cinctus]
MKGITMTLFANYCPRTQTSPSIKMRCSKQILLKYGILWITKSTQTIESIQSSIAELNLACKVLGSLITQCKEIPELQKQISTQNVKQLITVVTNLEQDRRCGATLYLIAILLHNYPEACEKLQTAIRRIILPILDLKNNGLVKAGANCYTLLSKATEKTFKPPQERSTYTGWIYSQALICNSLHEIMDRLFTGLIELESIDIWDKLVLPEISQDNIIEYYYGLEHRFFNLCIYLSTMLRGYRGKNSVSPNDILQVLCRGLAVTPCNLGIDDSFRKQILHFILPKLHISLFSVLDSFIDGFRQDLVPFALTILQLYQQTLKWSASVPENLTTFSEGKPFKNVRIAVYKSLQNWLMYLGTLSGIEMVGDELLPHILKDITPEKDRVVLTVQKTHNLSKRALKRLRESQYENSTNLGSAMETTKEPCLNAELCNVALLVLQNLFSSGGCWLKPSFYKSVQNVIVPLLYDFYLGSTEQNFYKENSECRLNLIRSLKSLQINQNPFTPAPTQYSIEIFEMALNDSNLSIIQESKLALAELEKVAHPIAPALEFPIRNGNIENKDSEEISSVLEKLNESVTNTSKSTRKNIWTQFKESQNENSTNQTTDNSWKDSGLSTKQGSITNGGPTPTKQKKSNNTVSHVTVVTSKSDPVALLMNNDESSAQQEDKIDDGSFDSTASVESNDKTKVSEEIEKDQNYRSSKADVSSYLTLKEIQMDEMLFATEKEDSNRRPSPQEVDIESTENKTVKETKEKHEEVKDGENVEDMLSLFCDTTMD